MCQYCFLRKARECSKAQPATAGRQLVGKVPWQVKDFLADAGIEQILFYGVEQVTGRHSIGSLSTISLQRIPMTQMPSFLYGLTRHLQKAIGQEPLDGANVDDKGWLACC